MEQKSLDREPITRTEWEKCHLSFCDNKALVLMEGETTGRFIHVCVKCAYDLGRTGVFRRVQG